MLTLLGVAVMVAGFVIRINPLIAIAAAALVSGLAAGIHPDAILAAFGKAFRDSRYVSLVYLVLPVIGILERYGLQERARQMIARFRGATVGRLLLAYLVLRQAFAAVGLTAIGGQAQMVRPLVAPMAEGALGENASETSRARVRAFAASADNVGAFFGEDIFVAVSSILLIRAFLAQTGVVVQPFELSVWALPTALLALVIHGTRLLLLDRRRPTENS
ncbi:MAG TPA: DUF969 family protein [Rhizomicrobium sp.]